MVANAARIAALCRRAGTVGVSVFAIGQRGGLPLVHLREFAPSLGYLEDPICGLGAAAAALSAHQSWKATRVLSAHEGTVRPLGVVDVIRNRRGVRINGEYVICGWRDVNLGTRARRAVRREPPP